MGTLKPQSNAPLYGDTVIGTLAVDEWAVTFGTATRGRAGCCVLNIIAHPSTATVGLPTSYYSMWHLHCKGLTFVKKMPRQHVWYNRTSVQLISLYILNATFRTVDNTLTSIHGIELYTVPTLCPKKGSHLMFDNIFGKCGPIFKILSQSDSWENLYVHTHTRTHRLPLHLRCVATLPCESRKSKKCSWFWQHP